MTPPPQMRPNATASKVGRARCRAMRSHGQLRNGGGEESFKTAAAADDSGYGLWQTFTWSTCDWSHATCDDCAQ